MIFFRLSICYGLEEPLSQITNGRTIMSGINLENGIAKRNSTRLTDILRNESGQNY